MSSAGRCLPFLRFVEQLRHNSGLVLGVREQGRCFLRCSSLRRRVPSPSVRITPEVLAQEQVVLPQRRAVFDDVDIGVLTHSSAQMLTARHARFAEVRPPVRLEASGDSGPTARADADEHVDHRLGREATHCRRPDVLYRKYLFAEHRATLRRDGVSSRVPGRVPLFDVNRLVHLGAHEIGR